MHTFMKTAQKNLKLKSIHLYLFDDVDKDDEAIQHYLSLPGDSLATDHKLALYKLLLAHKNDNTLTYQTDKLDDIVLTSYAFGDFGALVMEPTTPLQNSVENALIPVINLLVRHFQHCQQHRELNEESRVNRKAQQTYALQAKQDPLTNLPNRREFRYSLSCEISNSQRYDYYGALMYIDLDNFKNVNDSLGHSIGDILLTEVARRLSTQARRGDRVFRIGGDEFVYILNNIGDTETEAVTTSKTVADRVIDTLSQPIDIGEYNLHVTPSIGIALFPDEYDDGNDSETILRHADTAMYRAKSQGRNGYAFFNPEMHVEASKRLIIEDYLRKAIHHDELKLEYQPIVNSDAKIVGAESLVRWNNPVLGKVSPTEFISIAEESNLILVLSQWITQHVCDFAETLYESLDESSDFQYISINVSPRQFIQTDFVESITSIIDRCRVPNRFIKLEFTENVLLDNIEMTIEKMQQLHAKDIDFLLDDFGTGYSSLAYLHKLPIKLLKIDKSFVTEIHNPESSTQTIVNAILVMAEELDIKCIVEGVERAEHVEFFRQRDIYGMQGFYFYKPVSGERLSEILTAKD